MTLSRQTKAAATARAVRTARAAKRAADLATVVAELQASGARSLRAIATELNRRGIPTASGRGEWQADTVRQLLARLPGDGARMARATHGRAKAAATARAVRTARAVARAADLASTIKAIQASGATSLRAIAAELNGRGIPTATGAGRWHGAQVRRVLARL